MILPYFGHMACAPQRTLVNEDPAMTATLTVQADNDASTQRPQPRRRIPLAELASRGSSVASPALGRVMPASASAGNVPVAAFQSFSS